MQWQRQTVASFACINDCANDFMRILCVCGEPKTELAARNTEPVLGRSNIYHIHKLSLTKCS